MGVFKSLSGYCRVEITTAALEETLFAVTGQGITLMDISYTDELTFRATVSRDAFLRLQNFLNRRGVSIKLIQKGGAYWPLKTMLRRPILIVGLLVYFFLTFYLPGRVLFVSVMGNQNIPDNLILEKASQCGIYFGASRKAVRSEKMKNALLSAVPELQWAGVNTKGCVAIISVQERKQEDIKLSDRRPNSIIARHEGIVQSITVLQGTPLCKVGEGVKQGQVLISGFTDCGLIIQLQQAKGEVLAYTNRKITALTPLVFEKRTNDLNKKTTFKIKIGKNIINLSKDSGISPTGCAKIYEEKNLSLPGGFSLPISLIKETCVNYEYISESLEADTLDWYPKAVEAYLNQDMVAGKILNAQTQTEGKEDVCFLFGKYNCLEMIGQIRYEENLQ